MESSCTERLLLDPKEAAKALSISPRKLWAMTASGELPSIKVGRLTRYPAAALQAWIDARQRGGRCHEGQ